MVPLQFVPGESRETLALTGDETYAIENLAGAIERGERARVRVVAANGVERGFEAIVRIDTPREVAYYRSGGILPYVLRQIASAAPARA